MQETTNCIFLERMTGSYEDSLPPASGREMLHDFCDLANGQGLVRNPDLSKFRVNNTACDETAYG